ncbi:hypothetical protein ACN47E_005856 [Coniothyrium glycines]
MIDLLLQHNAHVNTADGACFVFAAQKEDSFTFEKLLLHGPKFTTVIPALFTSKLSEGALVASLKLCLKHGLVLSEVERGDHKMPLLILALTEYPRGNSIMKFLLTNGLNPGIFTEDVVDVSTGPETMPIILWALNQPQKRISDAVIITMVEAGASVIRTTSASDMTALMLASRESRHELVSTLLKWGSEADARDTWNRSALFYASRLGASSSSTVQVLASITLKNDGSLHEVTRTLQRSCAAILIQNGHDPNFPSRLHGGRNVLGELCLNGHVASSKDRSALRQILRLLLDNAANAKFKVRNEKSCLLLALDNAYSAQSILEALLETEVWQDINDPAHIYHDPTTSLCYSPISYISHIPTPSRTPSVKAALTTLLLNASCEPKYYSLSPTQPVGATGIPPNVLQLVNAQRSHDLALSHAKERAEYERSATERLHLDGLRRAKEKQDADIAAQSAAQAHTLLLERQKHEFEIQRMAGTEATKRAERAKWHSMSMEQERDAAARRLSVERTKAGVEERAIEVRKGELEHRVGVERRLLKDKEEVYERNVARQKDERPAIDGAPQWGNVD